MRCLAYFTFFRFHRFMLKEMVVIFSRLPFYFKNDLVFTKKSEKPDPVTKARMPPS